MQEFIQRLWRGIVGVLLFVGGAIFAFSLLVAGLIGALLIGLAALFSGGRIKARRVHVPRHPHWERGRGRGEVVDVEVREVPEARIVDEAPQPAPMPPPAER